LAPTCLLAFFRPFRINRLRTLLHFFALFCTYEKCNSLLFKRLRTLCEKIGGWGVSRGGRTSSSTLGWMPKLLITTSLSDPYPPAPPFRGFLSRRNTPSRRSATSSAPNASVTSAGTGSGVPFSIVPAAPSPVPGCARLDRHAVKTIPTAAATSG